MSEKRGRDWENVAGRVGVCQVGKGERQKMGFQSECEMQGMFGKGD